jgi:hypothetical protein
MPVKSHGHIFVAEAEFQLVSIKLWVGGVNSRVMIGAKKVTLPPECPRS